MPAFDKKRASLTNNHKVNMIGASKKIKTPTPIGQRFTRLVVIGDAPPKNGAKRWMCKCDCGNEKDVRASHILSGDTKSCGCFSIDVIKKVATTHGYSGRISEYDCWQSMRQRCLKKFCNKYKNYGGRGITICERWLNSFPNFLADMGMKPTPQHSIHRIDNNGNYEPSNCRWATPIEQANNRRNSKFVTWRCQTKTVAEWARQTGILESTIAARLKRGRSNEQIFSPVCPSD